MGGDSKKGGDDNDIPQINPEQLLQKMAEMNRVNVQTPFGSQTYNGNTLTTQLTPEMQALLGQQMARAGGAASQYVLPQANANILNGLNTRLDQRYGIAAPALPGAGGSSSPPGAGSGGPAPVPTSPTPQQPAPTPQPPPGGYTPGNGLPSYTQPDPSFGGELYTPRGQAGAGAHYGEEYVGGMCVAANSLLPGGVIANEAIAGHAFPVHRPELGFHHWALEHRADAVRQPCVQLTIAGGATLRCSRTTPFTFPSASRDLEEGHWAYAPDMLGQSVYVLTPDGHEAREVERVDDIGEQWVVPLSFGGRSFAAGDDPKALIYSHNIAKDGFANVVGDVYGFGDAGMSGNRALSGAIDQSHMAAANFGFGPMAQGPEVNYGSVSDPTSVDKGSKTDATKSTNLTPVSYPRTGTPGSSSTGGFGVPIEAMPALPMPSYLQRSHNPLDNKYAGLAALLLGGPAAALGLKAINKFRHRNDDAER